MRYLMIYEEYCRDSFELNVVTFEAPSNIAALAFAHPGIGYGCGDHDTEKSWEEWSKEFKKDNGVDKITEEDLVESICSINGDGTDMLMYLKNLDNGDRLFNENVAVYEDTKPGFTGKVIFE